MIWWHKENVSKLEYAFKGMLFMLSFYLLDSFELYSHGIRPNFFICTTNHELYHLLMQAIQNLPKVEHGCMNVEQD